MKVALIGYGKMGKTIEQVLNDMGDTVVLKISEENKHDFNNENLRKADVAIEFTRPDSAVENIKKCLAASVPVVVGTTAWLEHLPEVKEACNAANGAVFYSPNFSIGVNIFWEVNRRLAELMDKQPQYEITMWESHHTEK
ncbi:MAG: 4-hydroxy-tetrahydrodipicolinate reductase, partial [Bacteroidia bacterium]|nr:4-hydroxy-tetrahydrodipicolinate reductase [Bacteroidia bacterium]